MAIEKINGIPDRVSEYVDGCILSLKLPLDVKADIVEGAYTTLKLFNVDLEDPDSEEAIQATVESWAQFAQENLDGSEDVEKMRRAVADEIRWVYLGPSAIQERLKELVN